MSPSADARWRAAPDIINFITVLHDILNGALPVEGQEGVDSFTAVTPRGCTDAGTTDRGGREQQQYHEADRHHRFQQYLLATPTVPFQVHFVDMFHPQDCQATQVQPCRHVVTHSRRRVVVRLTQNNKIKRWKTIHVRMRVKIQWV